MNNTIKKKKILIWFQGLDEFLGCKPGFQVAGMFVQLACWAKLFIREGCHVLSLTNGRSSKKGDITYLHWRVINKIEVIHELCCLPFLLLKERPQYVLINGATRTLFCLDFWCKIFNIKLIFIAASDMDFSTKIGFISGKAYNTKLYWHALKKGNIKFVVQNTQQQKDLKDYFGRESIIIPNVWTKLKFETNEETTIKSYDIVWVANIKSLKRPDWVLKIAKELPQYTFAMAGNCACNKEYFSNFLEEVKNHKNVQYLGGIPFHDASNLIHQSKVLLCTSEFEGLPNTFLQAWESNIPIISTVDPNNVFSQHKIGIHATTVEEIISAIQHLLSDNTYRQELQTNIQTYYCDMYEKELNLSSIIAE